MDNRSYRKYKELFEEIKDKTAEDNWDMNPVKAEKHRKEARKLMFKLHLEFGVNDEHVRWFETDMDWWLR